MFGPGFRKATSNQDQFLQGVQVRSRLSSIFVRIFVIFPCWFEKEFITTGHTCIFSRVLNQMEVVLSILAQPCTEVCNARIRSAEDARDSAAEYLAKQHALRAPPLDVGKSECRFDRVQYSQPRVF